MFESLSHMTDGKEKRGNHYYVKGETPSFEDTLVEEEEGIKEKVKTWEDDAVYIWEKFVAVLDVVKDMAMGFFD